MGGKGLATQATSPMATGKAGRKENLTQHKKIHVLKMEAEDRVGNSEAIIEGLGNQSNFLSLCHLNIETLLAKLKGEKYQTIRTILFVKRYSPEHCC